MSTYYTLWSDPAATPLDYSDDVVVASSGTLFETKRQVDKSAALRENSASWPGHAFWSLPDCTSDAYHNAWWTLTTVTTPGTYRLQVTTTNAANVNDQKGTSAENMWALRAVSSDPTYKAYVYGLGKMVIYANVANGTTLFYLGRIEAVHAGKTMVIQLFDPGDASGNSSIEVLKPTSTGYTPATFSYTADSNATGSRSGTNVTSLRTTISGTGQYNNSWVTLTIPLPKTYTAPLPPASRPAPWAAGGRSATRSTASRPTRRPGRPRSGATPSTSSSPESTRPARPNGRPRWYFRRVGPAAAPGDDRARAAPAPASTPDIAEEPDSAWRWSSTTAAREAGSSSSWASSWRSWPAARRSS